MAPVTAIGHGIATYVWAKMKESEAGVKAPGISSW
jgi:hypothetical protein